MPVFMSIIFCVSIHAPTRGATQQVNEQLQGAWCFNPRTHTGCDSPHIRLPCVGQCFNPRTHTGCDPLTGIPGLSILKFQSTHPHGVRHGSQSCGWSASCFNPRTHTGCDFLSATSLPTPCSFNPRTHTGCDIPSKHLHHGVIVSIHAPTRGATSSLCNRPDGLICFNPRTHTGCDLVRLSY